MKRSALRRKTPLRQRRREGADVEREPKPMAHAAPAPVQPVRRGTYAGSTTGVPVPKENVLHHHAGYENAVRGLGYCMLCGRACRPQFCHRDQGKGMGLKTDVREGWPGCGPGDHGPGCHWLVGTSGQFAKEERRILEKRLGRKTRAAVIAAGAWPARLPRWMEN